MTIKLIVIILNMFHAGAGDHAKHFHIYGEKYFIHPLLIAAVSMNESRFKQVLVSRTNDYGLMQLHVSRRTRPQYIGLEKLLFKAKLNIHLGSRAMFHWRRYHEKNCAGKDHHWLLHYNQGVRVSTKGWKGGYADRVLKIYRSLIKIKMKLRERNATS